MSTLWRLAFVAAIAINLYGIYAPSQPGPAGPPGMDKAFHLLSFALIMATGMVAGIRPLWLALVLLVHAVGSEVIQATLLPNRSGDVFDALADVCGIALGFAAARLWQRRQRRRATR